MTCQCLGETKKTLRLVTVVLGLVTLCLVGAARRIKAIEARLGSTSTQVEAKQ